MVAPDDSVAGTTFILYRDPHMFIAPAVSVLQRPSVVARRTLVRTSLVAFSVASVLLAFARTLTAQTAAPSPNAWELRFTSGAFVPVGNQRRALDDAQVSAAQLSWVVRPSLAITGTFGWARSRDLASTEAHKLDVFTTDLGMEYRLTEWFADRAVTFTPFAGVGAGARSYNYRKLDVDATNNLAAYGAVGGEVGMGRIGIRLEVRDYASGFRPLVSDGRIDTRNDMFIMAGVRFNRQRASR